MDFDDNFGDIDLDELIESKELLDPSPQQEKEESAKPEPDPIPPEEESS